jgi:hypothetical protein
MVVATSLIVSTICRSALSLFELVVDDETNDPVHPTNTDYHNSDYNPLKDSVYFIGIGPKSRIRIPSPCPF